MRLCLSHSSLGDECGATFIDRAFLEWLQPKLQDVDLTPENFTTGGHLAFEPTPRFLLRQFEPIKHAFDGSQTSNFQLRRGTKVAPGNEATVQGGSVNLTA